MIVNVTVGYQIGREENVLSRWPIMRYDYWFDQWRLRQDILTLGPPMDAWQNHINHKSTVYDYDMYGNRRATRFESLPR